MQLVSDVRFGRVQVRASSRQVLVDGHRLPLGDRAFDLLTTLIAHGGRVVTKAELLDAVWRGHAVGEGNLHVHIASLRRHLGEQAIVTVHGRGYRLALAPTADSAPAASGHMLAVARQPLPGLLGREAELRDGLARLRPGACLALVGPGGVGKTRLARELALCWCSRATPEGNQLWWCDLSQEHTPARLPEVLARSLGLPGDPIDAGAADGEESAAFERLAARAANLRGLWVLDNAEHLLASVAAAVESFGGRAPHLTLLVTSRHAIERDPARTLVLAGLRVPPTADEPGALRAAAVELFCAHAARSDPDFVLDAESLDDVLTICRRLDGLPLALQLAAARVPLLGPRGVVQALSARLEAFTADAASGPHRHLSLRSVLEWTEQLLTEDERALLQVLAVFDGSFSLDEAAEVAAMPDHWRFVACFDALRLKCLVTQLGDEEIGAAPGPGGAAGGLAQAESPRRWRLLQTTQVFALARLRTRGGYDTAARRHAQAFAARAEALHAQWLGSSRAEIDIDREFERSLANCIAALDWACDEDAADGEGRLVLAARLLCACTRTFLVRGLTTRAAAWLRALARRARASGEAGGAADRLLALPTPLAVALHSAAALVAPSCYLGLAAATGSSSLDIACAELAGLADDALAFEVLLVRAHFSGRAGQGGEALAALTRARDSLSHLRVGPRARARLLEMQLRLFALFDMGAAPAGSEIDEALADLESAQDSDSRVAYLLRIEQADLLLLGGRHRAAQRALQEICNDVQARGRWHWRSLFAPFDTLAMVQLLCREPDSAEHSIRLALEAALQADLWGEVGAVLSAYLAVRGRHRAAMELHGAVGIHLEGLGRAPDKLQSMALCAALRQVQATCRVPDIARWQSTGRALGPAGLRSLLVGSDPRFMP